MEKYCLIIKEPLRFEVITGRDGNPILSTRRDLEQLMELGALKCGMHQKPVEIRDYVGRASTLRGLYRGERHVFGEKKVWEMYPDS